MKPWWLVFDRGYLAGPVVERSLYGDPRGVIAYYPGGHYEVSGVCARQRVVFMRDAGPCE